MIFAQLGYTNLGSTCGYHIFFKIGGLKDVPYV